MTSPKGNPDGLALLGAVAQGFATSAEISSGTTSAGRRGCDGAVLDRCATSFPPIIALLIVVHWTSRLLQAMYPTGVRESGGSTAGFAAAQERWTLRLTSASHRAQVARGADELLEQRL